MIEINDLKLRRGWFMTQDNHPTPKKKKNNNYEPTMERLKQKKIPVVGWLCWSPALKGTDMPQHVSSAKNPRKYVTRIEIK